MSDTQTTPNELLAEAMREAAKWAMSPRAVSRNVVEQAIRAYGQACADAVVEQYRAGRNAADDLMKTQPFKRNKMAPRDPESTPIEWETAEWAAPVPPPAKPNPVCPTCGVRMTRWKSEPGRCGCPNAICMHRDSEGDLRFPDYPVDDFDWSEPSAKPKPLCLMCGTRLWRASEKSRECFCKNPLCGNCVSYQCRNYDWSDTSSTDG